MYTYIYIYIYTYTYTHIHIPIQVLPEGGTVSSAVPEVGSTVVAHVVRMSQDGVSAVREHYK